MEEQRMHGFKVCTSKALTWYYICELVCFTLCVHLCVCVFADLDQSVEANCPDCQTPHWYSGAVEGPQRARCGRVIPTLTKVLFCWNHSLSFHFQILSYLALHDNY